MPYEGAYVSQSKTLSWICNNTKKMKPPLESSVSSTTGSVCDTAVSIPNEAAVQKEAPLPGKFSYAAAASKVSPTSQLTPITAPKGSKSPSPVAKKGTEVSEVECWTLTSTREFGAANKVQ